MLRHSTILLLVLWLGACASTPDDVRPPGKEHCESFFIYVLCISDLDTDGQADYMYFEDTREIFMYADDMLSQLNNLLPLHACAIPMSESTREYSSQLVYSEDLSLSARLTVKARLAVNYRAAQPAVDACVASLNPEPDSQKTPERPFDDEDDWQEESH